MDSEKLRHQNDQSG